MIPVSFELLASHDVMVGLLLLLVITDSTNDFPHAGMVKTRSNNETPGFQENRVSWKHTKWSTCFGVHYPSSGPYQSNS